MSLYEICENIKRLILQRREAKSKVLVDRINTQLDKLYDWKYELLKK